MITYSNNDVCVSVWQAREHLCYTRRFAQSTRWTLRLTIPHPKHTEVDIGFLSLYNNHLSPNLNADPPETEMQFFLM